MNIESLTDKYATSRELSFRTLGDGLVVLDVSNTQASASICLQGAQLLEWTPADTHPVIWLSEQAAFMRGKSIRGGVPVCWPWFGNHESDTSLPAHGVARQLQWDLESVHTQEEGTTELLFRLESSDQTVSMWPYAFELRLSINIGTKLEMSLESINRDTRVVRMSEALHTYFNISDINKVTITGLEACHYLDKPDAYLEKIQAGAIRVSDEIDRIYLDTVSDCIIEDPGLNRKIVISKYGSQSTVVWNPWIEKSAQMSDMGEQGYLHMLCIESANAAANSISLHPGERHTLGVKYQLINL